MVVHVFVLIVVCFSERQHKNGCANRTNFRSEFLGNDDDVTEINEFLRIDFQLVDVVLTISTRGDKLINSPLQFGNANMQLQSVNGTLCFESTTEKKRTITVVDENNKRRLKLDVDSHSLVINNFYKFTSDGGTKYNRMDEQNPFGRSDCELKVYTDGHRFKMRLKWKGMFNYIDCYPNGITLRDP